MGNSFDKKSIEGIFCELLQNKDMEDSLTYTINSDIREGLEQSGLVYYRDISSQKKCVGKLVVKIKAAIRKAISFVVGPIIEQQTFVNRKMCHGLLHTFMYVKAMENDGEAQAKYSLLYETVKEKDEIIASLEKQNKALEKRIEDIEKRMSI